MRDVELMLQDWWRSHNAWHKYVTRPLAIFVLLYGAFLLAGWTYYQFAPLSAFVEYHDITAAGFEKDGSLRVEVVRTVRRTEPHQYVDDLQCKSPGGPPGWQRYLRSTGIATAVYEDGREQAVQFIWLGTSHLFGGNGLIDEGSVCRIQRNIVLRLPANIRRPGGVTGTEFVIREYSGR